MKILHVNTSDISGGAARAAYRIHKGLQGIGISSKRKNKGVGSSFLTNSMIKG